MIDKLKQDSGNMLTVYIVAGGLRGGGSERFAVNLANALSDKGHKVFLATSEKVDGEYVLENSVERLAILGKGFANDVKILVKSMNELHPDISISIGLLQNIYLCASKLFISSKVIISERNDPVHDYISFKSRAIRYLLYRFSDGYVFQTEGAKSFYSHKIQKAGTVIHNPIKNNLPKRLNKVNKKIVAVGRLMPQKNYAVLIGAFSIVKKKHDDYTLHIYGEGLDRERIKRYIAEADLNGCVYLEGFQTDVHQCIMDADIYVLSSDFEGMPNSLMEAMAMGFPVVSTDCPPGGPKELIIDGYNGLLCKVGDMNGMAECMIKLINDRDLNEKISKNAMCIEKDHGMTYICNKWEQYMRLILGKNV